MNPSHTEKGGDWVDPTHGEIPREQQVSGTDSIKKGREETWKGGEGQP